MERHSLVKIFVYQKLKTFSKKKFNKLFSFLTKAEQKKILKLKNKMDIENSLLARFLVKKIISSALGVKLTELKFKRNKFGQLFLKYPVNQKIYFSISHSDKIIVVAISFRGQIGVDVERIRPINLKIIKDYLTLKEQRYLFLGKDKKLEHFYKIWTLKESYVKAIGQGLFFPLKKCEFTIKNNDAKMKLNNQSTDWRFKLYKIGKNYQAALCFQKGPPSKRLNIISGLK